MLGAVPVTSLYMALGKIPDYLTYIHDVKMLLK